MCDGKDNGIFIKFIEQLDATTKGRKRRGQNDKFWVNFTLGENRHVRFKISGFNMKTMREDLTVKKERESNLIITPDQFRNGIVSGSS